MQKEAEEVVQECQNAEEKAKKAAIEVGPLTTYSILSPRVHWRSGQGAGAHLQPKSIPLISHTAKRRLV